MKRYYVAVGFGRVAVVDSDLAPTMKTTFNRDTAGVIHFWNATQDNPRNRASKWGSRERKAAYKLIGKLNASIDKLNAKDNHGGT